MSVSRRFKAALAVLTVTAALVPHRGDTGPDAVTHAEWAFMMLRGLELEEALEFVDTASRAFAVLSWRESDRLGATQHIAHSDHGVELEPGAPALLRARQDLGEVSFPVTVARAGEYQLRVRMAGEPESPATVDVVALRGGQASSLTLAPTPSRGWIEAPVPLRLHPGAYRATFALPRGTVFERLELVPRCIAPVEPLGGWQLDHVLDAEDLAVTLVRAVDRERELPPADVPIEASGSELAGEGDHRPLVARLEGGTRGTRATVTLEVPMGGLYALSAFGVRTLGQRWAADGCRTAVSCPVPSRLPSWWVVMTAPLSAGRHSFTVDLGPGDSVERVRLERRKEDGPDYVDALRRMGFDPGEGAVTRRKADEALSWLRKRHRIELSQICFEPGGPARERVALAPPRWSDSVSEPPATPPGPGPTPTPPVPGPTPTPVPGPTPTPPGPAPPPRPPCQPPSSPVLPDPCVGP